MTIDTVPADILKTNRECKDLDADAKQLLREGAKERYLAYMLLRNSGKQHSKLRQDLLPLL